MRPIRASNAKLTATARSPDPSENCGTPVTGPEEVPMTIGVLAVAKAVTGMSPHIVSGDVKVVETGVHELPFQYFITVVDVTREELKQTWAVPAVSPRMDRS